MSALGVSFGLSKLLPQLQLSNMLQTPSSMATSSHHSFSTQFHRKLLYPQPWPWVPSKPAQKHRHSSNQKLTLSSQPSCSEEEKIKLKKQPDPELLDEYRKVWKAYPESECRLPGIEHKLLTLMTDKLECSCSTLHDRSSHVLYTEKY